MGIFLWFVMTGGVFLVQMMAEEKYDDMIDRLEAENEELLARFNIFKVPDKMNKPNCAAVDPIFRKTASVDTV